MRQLKVYIYNEMCVCSGGGHLEALPSRRIAGRLSHHLAIITIVVTN